MVIRKKSPALRETSIVPVPDFFFLVAGEPGWQYEKPDFFRSLGLCRYYRIIRVGIADGIQRTLRVHLADKKG